MHDKNYIGGWDSYFEPNKANTNWGKWGPVKLCPSNGFGIGFDLKVRFIIGMDNSYPCYILGTSQNECIFSQASGIPILYYVYIYDFVGLSYKLF